MSSLPSFTGFTLSSSTIDENGILVISGTYSDTAASDSLTVNWGDNTTPDTLPVSGGVYVFAHQYLYPSSNIASGKFPIAMTLTNSLSQSATASTAVTVLDLAPADVSLTLTGITPAPLVTGFDYATVYVGTTLSFSGSYTELGTVGTQAQDWHVVSNDGQVIPDGTASTFSFTPNANGPNGSPATYVVTYTVTDNFGGVGSAPPFFLTVDPFPPTIALSGPAVTRAGSPYTLTLGAITEPAPLDHISGYEINWGDGTLLNASTAGNPANTTQAHTYSGGAGSDYAIQVTLIDSNGTNPNAGSINAQIISSQGNTVVTRDLFYADSSFEGLGASAAIATNKTALLPGQTASFSNYSSYNLGINGVIVDLAGIIGPITASDFTFKIGNSASTASWTAAPSPISVISQAGAGTGGSNRIAITWADAAITNTWLQITVKADGNTGLASPDVFYFGNEIGSTGDLLTTTAVTATDQILVRNNPLGDGATFYVSPSGNDSNNGSESAPWATLQHAADTVVAGDTVIVGAGVYNVGMDILGEAGGTQTDPIRFIANPGAIITHCATEGLSATLAGINIESTGGWYVIEGFDIESDDSMTRAGIRVADSNNVTLINNTVDHAYIGIFADDSNNLLVQGNTCENSTDQHGIYLSGCNNYTVLGNTLTGNNWDGLHLNISGDPNSTNNGGIVENNIIYANGLSGIDMEGVTNGYFVNNVIYANGKHGITLHNLDQPGTVPCTGNVFINNTVDGNGDFAVQLQAGGNVANMFFNNILIGGSQLYGAIGISGSPAGLISNHNIVNNNFSPDLGMTQYTLAQWRTYTGDETDSFIASAAQVFVNSSAANFQLAAGSPAIDAGVGVYLGQAAPANDFLGGSRPAGATWDIGAYEYGAIANPATFAVSLAGASLTDPYDFNRDGRVDSADEAIARANQTNFVTALSLITAPSSGFSLQPALFSAAAPQDAAAAAQGTNASGNSNAAAAGTAVILAAAPEPPATSIAAASRTRLNSPPPRLPRFAPVIRLSAPPGLPVVDAGMFRSAAVYPLKIAAAPLLPAAPVAPAPSPPAAASPTPRITLVSARVRGIPRLGLLDSEIFPFGLLLAEKPR